MVSSSEIICITSPLAIAAHLIVKSKTTFASTLLSTPSFVTLQDVALEYQLIFSLSQLQICNNQRLYTVFAHQYVRMIIEEVKKLF